MVVVGALVYKIGGFGQHIEPVREPGGDPELLLSSRGQRDPVPLSATGRLSPAVDDDVKNGAGGHSNQLALRFFCLKVQSAKGSLRRAAVVVLHERQ